MAENPQPRLPSGEYWVVGGESPDVKKASFRLCGDQLDPDAVTRAIGLSPDRSHRKGDVRQSKTGRHHTYGGGLWLIDSSIHVVDATYLDEHITWLLDRLEPARDRLRLVCAEQALTSDFYCGYFMHQWNSSIGLSPQTIARIAALDAGVVIDIYGPDPDEPDRIEVVSEEDRSPDD